MDAVLLREAGGIGDVLQVGSVATLLHRAGYVVHFYTLADPSMLEIGGLIRGIDYVHPLRVLTRERRWRSSKDYDKHPYLYTPITHALGTTNVVSPPNKQFNKLFDMFCPAVRAETADLELGGLPKFSRAESFAHAAGFRADRVKPPRLRPTRCPPEFIGALKERIGGGGYTVFAPYSMSRCRSVGDTLPELLGAMTEEFGHVVILDYCSKGYGEHFTKHPKVLWFPQDFQEKTLRGYAVHQVVELIKNADRVLSVDSGPAHLAAALGRPLAMLPGPTRTSTVMQYYDNVVDCKPRDSSCAYCYYRQDRGFVAACEKSGCRVIDSIEPGAVISSLEEVSACVSL